MKITTRFAVLTATIAVGALPAVAIGAGIPDNAGTAHMPSNSGTAHMPADPGSQGTANRPDATPPASASLPAKAKAYGRYCQNQSKKHVAGEKGTPFSKCVTAMAKLANGTTKNPRTACKDESKKHVAGEKGTPFSRCVSAGAKLLNDQPAS
jgi:hypothetical protein